MILVANKADLESERVVSCTMVIVGICILDCMFGCRYQSRREMRSLNSSR